MDLQTVRQNLPVISETLLDKALFTFMALIIAGIISTLLKKTFQMFRRSIQKRHLIPIALMGKSNTINSILFSLIDVVVYAVTFLIILSKWDVDIAPILTGAGIFGLALTFGSQTLIKDIIAGFFILAENQFNVGDRIRINKDAYEGIVSRVTLRITVLRDDNGNKVFLPNSSILAVILLKDVNPPIEVKEKKTIKESTKK